MAGKKASLALRLELRATSRQLMTNVRFSGICDADYVVPSATPPETLVPCGEAAAINIIHQAESGSMGYALNHAGAHNSVTV